MRVHRVSVPRFIHSPVDGHLGCFHLRAAVDLGVQALASSLSFFWVDGQTWDSASHGSSVCSCLRKRHFGVHTGLSVLLFPSNARGSSLSASSLTLVVSRSFVLVGK